VHSLGTWPVRGGPSRVRLVRHGAATMARHCLSPGPATPPERANDAQTAAVDWRVLIDWIAGRTGQRAWRFGPPRLSY